MPPELLQRMEDWLATLSVEPYATTKDVSVRLSPAMLALTLALGANFRRNDFDGLLEGWGRVNFTPGQPVGFGPWGIRAGAEWRF